MKTIQARVTKNIKEDPSIEECDIWNIEATFLDTLPDDVMSITTDPVEIGVNQLEEARADSARTSITIRTQSRSRLEPVKIGELFPEAGAKEYCGLFNRYSSAGARDNNAGRSCICNTGGSSHDNSLADLIVITLGIRGPCGNYNLGFGPRRRAWRMIMLEPNF